VYTTKAPDFLQDIFDAFLVSVILQLLFSDALQSKLRIPQRNFPFASYKFHGSYSLARVYFFGNKIRKNFIFSRLNISILIFSRNSIASINNYYFAEIEYYNTFCVRSMNAN